MMTAIVLAILALGAGLWLWARKVERQRRLVCKVFSRLRDARRTWKFGITSESDSAMTLGRVVVSGRIGVCVRREEVVVNARPITLPPRAHLELDLEPSFAELLETLGRPGQGDPASVLDLGFDISYVAISRRRRRTARCIALCDHQGLLGMLGEPAPLSGGTAKVAARALVRLQ
jgi:hypothetical protein